MATRLFVHCDHCGKPAKGKDGKIATAPVGSVAKMRRTLRSTGWRLRKPIDGGDCCPECVALIKLRRGKRDS